jgi:ribosomal protein S18 acetylase RimI-like enzyme
MKKLMPLIIWLAFDNLFYLVNFLYIGSAVSIGWYYLFSGLFQATVFGKSFTEGYPDDGEISAIYLHHDYIGKGHGHAFMREVEELLAVKGYADFVMDVLFNNARAVRFYLAHGYEIVEESAIKLGERDYPIIVMRKRGTESYH